MLATIAIFVIFSLGLGILAQYLLTRFHVPLHAPLWLALLVVFGILGLVNLSGLPLPIGVSIMLIAAEHWNPVLIALAGSLGASLGEFTSYFFGYLGERLSINEDTPGYKLVQSWILKYGMWAIALLSFQPVIPFELGGFIADWRRCQFASFCRPYGWQVSEVPSAGVPGERSHSPHSVSASLGQGGERDSKELSTQLLRDSGTKTPWGRLVQCQIASP